MLHCQQNQVKKDPETKMVQDMYGGVDSSTKRDVIHIKVTMEMETHHHD